MCVIAHCCCGRRPASRPAIKPVSHLGEPATVGRRRARDQSAGGLARASGPARTIDTWAGRAWRAGGAARKRACRLTSGSFACRPLVVASIKSLGAAQAGGLASRRAGVLAACVLARRDAAAKTPGAARPHISGRPEWLRKNDGARAGRQRAAAARCPRAAAAARLSGGANGHTRQVTTHSAGPYWASLARHNSRHNSRRPPNKSPLTACAHPWPA